MADNRLNLGEAFKLHRHPRSDKHPGEKLCPVCETVFQRPSGKSDEVWEKQVCCGRDCSNIYKRKEKTIKPARRKDLVPGGRRYKGWGK